MYLYVIRMSLVCTLMSSVSHSYVLVCHPYLTRMYSYVIRMSLICTHMSSVCHSYVLVCYPYVTRMYSYIIRMSLVSTSMSSVCQSYVLICHPYDTRMYWYVICVSLVSGFTMCLLTYSSIWFEKTSVSEWCVMVAYECQPLFDIFFSFGSYLLIHLSFLFCSILYQLF